ncbi:hypothetical protein ACFW04_014117 [Cataglyphis niger]
MGQNLAEADHTPPAYREERREINESTNDIREIMREMIQDMRQKMRQEIRNIRAEICDIRNREPRQGRQNEDRTPPRDRNDTAFDFTSDDVRHQRGRGFLSLKEDRGMIPEFDGSTHKLQKFLSATTYALEICYASKKSTIHLQIEFNTIKTETIRERANVWTPSRHISYRLYESMMEKRHHTVDKKQAIMEIIQQQALENFQIGLNDDIKTIVQSRRYATLQEAITAAKEKVKELPATSTRHRTNSASTYKNENKMKVQCNKCGITVMIAELADTRIDFHCQNLIHLA